VTTKTRTKRPRGAKRAGKSGRPEAPAGVQAGNGQSRGDEELLFKHDRFAILEAAREWMKARHVRENLREVWLLALPDTPHVEIGLSDWSWAANEILVPWTRAGWQIAPKDAEYALVGAMNWAMLRVQMGVSLAHDSVALHEIGENDRTFRRFIHHAGLRRLSGQFDAKRVSPEKLMAFVEKHLPQWERENARALKADPRPAARKPTPASRPPTPDSHPPAPASTAPVPAFEQVAPLSAAERKDLARQEAIIERGKAAFLEMGNALSSIRDQRLYRAEHATFEAYCRERWGFGRAEAFDKIKAAKVARIVSPISDKAHVPLLESHCKALGPLAEEPKDVEAVYRQTVQRCRQDGVQVTEKRLLQARREYTTPGDELERDAKRGSGDGGRGTEKESGELKAESGGPRDEGGETRRKGEKENGDSAPGPQKEPADGEERSKPWPDLATAIKKSLQMTLERLRGEIDKVVERWGGIPQAREQLASLLLGAAERLEGPTYVHQLRLRPSRDLRRSYRSSETDP
jgi:hypothetical protein